MSTPMTPDAAMARLRQYQERPAPTWSTASYGANVASAALAQIGRTLADEVERLRHRIEELVRQRDDALVEITAGDPAPLGPVTPLRWGLDDVEYGDDDTVTLLLSGPGREPYALELDPERAGALRAALAGPEGDTSRAAVLREAQDATVAWLERKAGEEYAAAHQQQARRATARARARRQSADLISTLADKVSRGAVRAFLDAASPVEPLTVYRASHDSIVMGLYTTRQAAYEHCEAHELQDDPVHPMTWLMDEDGVAELARMRVPDVEARTGYVVTPLEVASEYDPEADA